MPELPVRYLVHTGVTEALDSLLQLNGNCSVLDESLCGTRFSVQLLDGGEMNEGFDVPFGILLQLGHLTESVTGVTWLRAN